MQSRVIVTGATGFVGSHLRSYLTERGHAVTAVARRAGTTPSVSTLRWAVVPDICSGAELDAAFDGAGAVVHLAARVHVLNDRDPRALETYRSINVRSTLDLARRAGAAGIRRFVFLSSIKVNGEGSGSGAYRATDAPAPADAYAISKLEAESALLSRATEWGIDPVIIRPPLVYGPGVKGNFLRLLNAVARGLPLPFGRVDNARSLVSVWNLCDLITLCVEHRAAVGRVWMVSDGQDLSTAELLRRLARCMNRPSHLPRVPVGMLALLARLVGRLPEFERLCGSLRVDISATRAELGWRPPLDAAESLRRTVDWYVRQRA